jgi:membrane protein
MRVDWLSPRAFRNLVKETYLKWSDDKVPRLGAALAYYTVFSIVPLLIIVIGIAGLVFGEQAAHTYIMAQVESLVGTQSASALEEMLRTANKPSYGFTATGIALVTLLVGASGVFAQLQDALNSIWKVEPKSGRGIVGLIKDRFLSFLAVLGTGFLLLVSLVVSALISAAGKFFAGWLPAPEALLHVVNLVVSFVVITVLFAMMFKFLPDARIDWNDVWIGAALTSLLFTIGKFLISLYLGKADIGSAFGAAGSFVIVLVWVYYSSQLLLFGAEFTAVYADRFGSRILPSTSEVT